MKASFVKDVYNKLPEGVKKFTGSSIRKKLIENEQFKAQFKELVQAESKSAEELEAMQLGLLRKTCIHAYEHTAYYRELFDQVGFDPYSRFSFEEFSNKVPTISKQQVLDNFEAINSDDISDDYPATTGGSSGTRLQVNNAWETFYRENAFHYHFMSLHGYDYKHDKTLLLAGEESEQLCSTSPLYNMIRVSSRYLNENNFSQALSFVNKAKPDIVIAIPSSAYQFCKYLRLSGLELDKKPKAVFYRSENVDPAQRKFIEATFGCPSFAYYGSTERIAWGEEQANEDGIPLYSFNPLYGYTEIDCEDGISLVATGFINPKMPLIRYKTDDILTQKPRGFFTIEGHRTAAIVGRDGENISVASYAHLEESFNDIEKYQLEQFEKGKLIVNVVPRHQLSKDDMSRLQDMFERMSAGKLDIELHVTDHVELTPRGKFKLLLHALPMEEPAI